MGLEWLAYAAMGMGTALQITGYDQAARAEKIKQDEIARQSRDNKLAIQLQAERDATARSQAYSDFLKNSSAIAGYNRRGADRSLMAIQEAAKETTTEELKAIQLQSLFSRGRAERRAQFAQLEGEQAMELSVLQSFSAITDMGMKAYNVSDTG